MAKAFDIYGDIKINSSGATKELTALDSKIIKVGKSMENLGKNMTKFLTLPILGAGVASVKLASDFEESLNKIDVAFGDSQQIVLDWSETTADKIGVSQGAALDMVATMGDMATAMGLTQDAAAHMGKSLVDRAGDLASFKNIRLEVAETALKGIYTGETESLKTLGVVMTQANLEIFALSQGIKTNIKDMTQAEKVNLRYAFVMDATSNSANDFSNTSESLANTLRSIRANLENAAVALGQKLLPIIKPVVDKILQFVKALTDLDDAQLKMILTIGAVALAIGPLIGLIGKFTVSLNFLAANPIVAIFLAMTAAIVGVSAALSRNTKEWRDQKDVLNDLQKTTAALDDEVITLTQEYNDLRDKTERTADEQERFETIGTRLTTLIPNMTAAILDNKIALTEQALAFASLNKTAAQTALNVAIDQQKKIKTALNDTFEQQVKVALGWGDMEESLSEIKNAMVQDIGSVTEAQKIFDVAVKDANNVLADTNQIYGDQQSLLLELDKEIVKGENAIRGYDESIKDLNTDLQLYRKESIGAIANTNEDTLAKQKAAEAARLLAEEEKARKDDALIADAAFYSQQATWRADAHEQGKTNIAEIMIAEEEAEARRQEIADIEKQRIADRIELNKKLFTEILSGAQSFFSALGGFYASDEKASIAAITNKVDTGVLTEAEGEKQISAIKKEAAKKQWELQGLQIAANIAQGISVALASPLPFPLNLIPIGFATAAGAAQVAAWSAAKPFAQGGEVPGNPATGDSVPAMLTPGEVVLTGRMQENLLALATRPALNYSTNNNYVAQAQRIDISIGSKLFYSEITKGCKNKQILVDRRSII